jgi:hypothetical protein
METKTLDYCGRDFTLLRVADHLWVSKESVNDQRLINEFSLEKFCWYSSFYTNDEVETEFNIDLSKLKCQYVTIKGQNPFLYDDLCSAAAGL